MAEVKASGKKRLKPTRQAKSDQNPTSLFAVRLSHLEALERLGDVNEDAEFSYAYHVELIEGPAYQDGVYIFNADILVGRLLDGEAQTEISASYYFLVKSDELPEDQIKLLGENYFSGYVWSRFEAQFNVLVSQLNGQFPRLPQSLDTIAWVDPEESA
ncbi:hypothetical protein [Stappia sp. ES.058]|uniref:hypothetical protein n=1 Tax=Stappia sp. ES.058 TaxID=1881061 RepID=UPI00087BE452|nr:hypothetical protein [Stappia sp. ES.058]SDU26328.1 hypothetical protein SAMN05428979_2614 [Stappia sp. ES.058]